ncbi:ECF transporter S component [Oenococcus sicerae]|uniref:ECF transporter S component n=1 Tax=Oenococcus sicerae TaxID=2203724 RepID=A0ABX5QLS7_9LACO|nr:ECF transporter S component [Oenococcus sicerae]QAS69749.1 ECF transporter S component [Oenococcus sicerae]
MQKNSWKIREVILAGLIGVIFGVLYFAFGIPWTAFMSMTAPIASFLTGHSLASSLSTSLVAAQVTTAATTGLWLMAGPIAALIIKKPGSAFLTNVVASIVELAIGSAWGVLDIIWGVVQGAGIEAGFAATRYKKPMLGLWLSTVTASLISFIYHYFEKSYYKFSFDYVLILFVIWFLSIFIFSGVIDFIIFQLLKKAKIVK